MAELYCRFRAFARRLPVGWRGGIASSAVGWIMCLSSALAQAPPNDNIANPQGLSGTSGRVAGSNVNATREAGEPTHPFNAGGKSIWYTWTATTTESVRFDTAGTAFDTILAVYTNSPTGLRLIGGTDNPNLGDLPGSGGYLESRVNLANARTDRIYYISVDGYNAGTGAASGPVFLNWHQTVGAPPNDDFSSAIVLTGISGGVSARNHNATKQNNEPNHAGNAGGRSVWFTWTAPAAGEMVIDTMGSTMDTLLAVYTGGNLNSLSTIATNDDAVPLDLNGDGTNDSAFIFFSRLRFAATSGTTYRIAVDGHNAGIVAAAGSVSLHYYFASAPPANDNFANATVISGTKGQIVATNLAATKQIGEPDHATSAGGRSVWFNWTAPAGGQVTFDTFGRHFDSVLAAYTGNTLATLTPVAVNDDVGVGVILVSRMSFAAEAGTTYRIVVDGWASTNSPVDFNPFSLNWELAVSAPTNDQFASAQVLPGSAGSLATSNTTAVFEQFEPLHGPVSGKSLWFQWTAPRDGEAIIDTHGSSFDTLLGLYSGPPDFFLLTTITNSDDTESNITSLASFAATAGTTYWIAVDGYNPGNGRGAENGTVVLNWTQSGGPPANDDLEIAFVLEGFAGSTNGSSRNATIEPGEPDRGITPPSASSWHRWTAPATGWFTFDTLGSALDTVLAVYEGMDFFSFQEIASNDDIDASVRQSRVTFRATNGIIYAIAVDGSAWSQGDFRLNWSPTAVLRISVEPPDVVATLTAAEPGLYEIQQSSNLVNWTVLLQVPVDATPVPVNLGPATAHPLRFFRASK